METTPMETGVTDANPNERSIRRLQYMLNELAIHASSLPRLVVNGAFDEPTLEAVMTFQRDFFPPVTGVVNNATWDAITAAYEKEQMTSSEPSRLRVLPDGSFQAGAGEAGQQIRLAQAMLNSLALVLSNFSRNDPDGHNSGSTQKDLRLVQALAGLPVTGTLDRATWEYLSRLYHIFVTRADQLPRVSTARPAE